MRLQVEHFPNPHYISIHVSVCVTQEPIATYGDGSILSMIFPSHEEAPDWVKTLLVIEGVISVTLRRYEVSVTKGTVFNWPELLPVILYTISTAFPGEWERLPDVRNFLVGELGTIATRES